MPLITKPNYNQIFASQAPEQDKPAVFNNYPGGWGVESRPNNGKPTIKGFNYLQQTSDLKDLWILQNGACLPYDESIEYVEGAPVLKDGVIQYKTASGFSPVISEKPYILKYFTEGALYPLNARVMLENGDIVKSTVAGNTVDPNVDMTGWGSIGFVSLDSHGAIGNGIVDDMKAFLSAANEAKLTNSVLTATKGKTYKLIGTSGQKLIECSVDLEGAILDISEMVGYITFSRGTENKIVHTSGALFDAFKALTAPELSEGNSYLPSLAAFDSLLENSGIIIRTNADFYPYRGEMKKYFEINYYNRGGNLSSGILKTFSASSITSIEVYKQTNIRRIENIVFDLKNRSDNGLLVSCEVDNSNIKNIQFKSANIVHPVGTNPLRFRLNSGFNTTVENIVFDYPIKNADSTYAYNILLNDLYSVTLKSIRGGDGEGWGVIVTDSPCRKLRVEDCKLNRIDTHYPLLERFESIDNDVGFLGYNISTVGDYIVRGGSVSLEKYSENRKSWGVFNTREEVGGVCDGKKFHVDGLTINISPRCEATEFFILNSNAGDVALLSSSMLKNKLFDEVIIENITINNKSSMNLGFQRLFPTINTNNPKMKFPKSVTVEKVSGNGFQFLSFMQDIPADIGTALDTSKHYSSLPFTQKITLRDINSPTDLFFVYNSAHMPWNLDINLDNVALPRNISATEIYGVVHSRFFGRLTMNNCKIGYIDYTSTGYTYSPSTQPYSLDVIMNSGLLSTRSGIQRGELFVWKGDLLNIKLNGTTILLNDTSEATLYGLAWVDHVNCDFIKPDRSKLTHYKIVSADGANTNFQRMREDKCARLLINTPSSSRWSFDVVCPSKNNPSSNFFIDITQSIKVKFIRNNTTNMIDLEFYVQNANGVYTLNTTSGYSFDSLEIAARQ